jgi:hypothetical protein
MSMTCILSHKQYIIIPIHLKRYNFVFLMAKPYCVRFIDIDIDVSMQRVLQRHIGTG